MLKNESELYYLLWLFYNYLQDKECYEKTTACDDSDVEHLPTDEDT